MIRGRSRPPPSSRVGARPKEPVAVIGGGPSGLTAALLLARAGHRVIVYERAEGLGGLWASQLDEDGFFAGDNSCKVYQSSYHTAPALFQLIGTSWEAHFAPRHDLTAHWLRPFVRDCSWLDLAKLARAFFADSAGFGGYRSVSVEEFLVREGISDGCRAWMRATALGGVTGTLRMTVWELFHRIRGNLGAILGNQGGVLHWNAQPPNVREGFVPQWQRALERLGVEIRTGVSVDAVQLDDDGSLRVEPGRERVGAVFFACPPPAMGRVLAASAPAIAAGFGHTAPALQAVLRESLYEHLGLAWFFDRPLPRDLPLGGHNVRTGWHPILVQHSQYRAWLRPPAVTCVTGSVSLATDFVHPRLGTRARDHAPEEMARILWDDERLADPTLPVPIALRDCGMSSATQVIRHGPLPVRCDAAEVYVATSLNGLAPYFTASLESAIQAGMAAAAAFDPAVERLPVGPTRLRNEVADEQVHQLVAPSGVV